MSTDKMVDLLKSKDRGVNKTYGANGILSRLWRQILVDLDIRESRFGDLLQAYVIDPRNGVPNNRRDQISRRGNLLKEFARPQMTWKVFCNAMKFINIAKIEFVINATHANGQISRHSTIVNLGKSITKDENGNTVVQTFDNTFNQPEHLEYVQPVPYLDREEGI